MSLGKGFRAWMLSNDKSMRSTLVPGVDPSASRELTLVMVPVTETGLCRGMDLNALLTREAGLSCSSKDEVTWIAGPVFVFMSAKTNFECFTLFRERNPCTVNVFPT